MKFFNFLEAECYSLDFKVAALTQSGKGLSDDNIKMMIKNYNTIQELESSIKDLETTIELIHDAVASNLTKFPEKAKDIENVYKPRIDWHQEKISEKVGTRIY